MRIVVCGLISLLVGGCNHVNQDIVISYIAAGNASIQGSTTLQGSGLFPRKQMYWVAKIDGAAANPPGYFHAYSLRPGVRTIVARGGLFQGHLGSHDTLGGEAEFSLDAKPRHRYEVRGEVSGTRLSLWIYDLTVNTAATAPVCWRQCMSRSIKIRSSSRFRCGEECRVPPHTNVFAFVIQKRTMLPSRFYSVVVALAVIQFAGCASVPPLNFTPPEVTASPRRLNMDLRDTIVTVAQGDERKGPITFSMEFSQTMPELWRTGLIDALSRLRIFTDASPTKVDLRVKILEFRVPPRGAGMTTELMARYQICDRASGAVLFSAEIGSSYSVPFSYSLDGTVRATESINQAVQANILKFIARLSGAAMSGHRQAMN